VAPDTRDGSSGDVGGAKTSVGGASLTLSEDTGLLRVGDASKRVRYVPAKSTTVVKRVKPPTDSDDEQACCAAFMLLIRQDVVLSQREPRDAAINFGMCRNLQRHRAVTLPQHGFLA